MDENEIYQYNDVLVNDVIESYREKLSKTGWARNVGVQRIEPAKQTHAAICEYLFDQCIDHGEEVYICFEEGLSNDIESHLSEDDSEIARRAQKKESYRDRDEGERDALDVSGSVILKASVLTKAMAEYDSIALTTVEELVELGLSASQIVERVGYRPYFIEFIFNKADLRGEMPSYEEGAWVKAKIASVSESKKWYDYRQNDGVLFSIFGSIAQSASPVVKKRTLEVSVTDELTDEEIQDINEHYEIIEDEIRGCAPDPSAQKELAHFFKEMKARKATCYSVGFANCLLIEGTNRSTGDRQDLLYDIGIDYRPEYEISKAAGFIADAASFKPGVVLLSHWDADHVFGCVYADDTIFGVRWVAPNYPALKLVKRTCVGSRRVACFLWRLKVLYPVAELGNRIFPLSSNNGNLGVSVYQGNKRGGDRKITPQNKCGLVLSLELPCSTGNVVLPRYALMCGDVPYVSLPSSYQSMFDECFFLVVPHHCCAMKLDLIRSLSYEKRLAIVCTSHCFSEFLCLECQAKPIGQSPKPFSSVRQKCLKRRCSSCRPSGQGPANNPMVPLEQNGLPDLPVKTAPDHIRELVDKGFRVFPTGEANSAIVLDFASGDLYFIDKNHQRYSKKYA